MAKKKRKPGSPKQHERVVTPEVLDRIEQLLLRGRGYRAITRMLREEGLADVAAVTVQHHEKMIRTSWNVPKRVTLEEQLASLDEVYRTAWEEYERSGDPEVQNTLEQVPDGKGAATADQMRVVKTVLRRVKKQGSGLPWIAIILQVIDMRLKILGAYKAPREEAVDDHRVAGRTVSEVDRENLDILRKAIAERKERDRIIAERN